MGERLREVIIQRRRLVPRSNLQIVVVYVGGKTSLESIRRNQCLVVRDDFPRYTRLFFLKHKSDALEKLEESLETLRNQDEIKSLC